MTNLTKEKVMGFITLINLIVGPGLAAIALALIFIGNQSSLTNEAYRMGVVALFLAGCAYTLLACSIERRRIQTRERFE
jgi:ACR3 family arsenite efflux pump ArsB